MESTCIGVDSESNRRIFYWEIETIFFPEMIHSETKQMLNGSDIGNAKAFR